MKNKRTLLAIIAALALFIAWPVYGIYYDLYSTNALVRGQLRVLNDATIDDDTNVKDLYIEGATADSYETLIAVEEPTADRTITLPDYTGGVPIIVDQSGVSSTANSGTSDVPSSTITPAAGWWVDGKTLMWELAGTISGQNAAKVFKLSVGNTDIASVSTATNAEGDFTCRITAQRGDDSISGVTEQVNIELCVASGDTVYYTDYGTSGITSFASGATSFRVCVTSANAGDQIFTKVLRIWHWFKS